jgi:hypothetical protein
MNLFRKFYDTAAPDQPSIASIMATQGVRNETSTPIAKEAIITPEKKEETQRPAPSAATASEPAKADPLTDSPKPEGLKPEEAKKEEPVKVPTWQEVLKSQQPDIIFKELGYDEDTAKYLTGRKGIDKKMLNFLTHWETNGDVNRYLQEASTNYDKMSAEDVMKLQLRREYPNATQKQLDVLFKKEILEAYKLTDAFSEEEAEEGRELLAVKADKLREGFKKDQENYLMPKAPEKKDDFEAEQAADKKLFDLAKSNIENNSLVKNLLKESKYTIGDGEDAYNLPLAHVNEAIENLLNNITQGIVLDQIKEADLAKFDDNYIHDYLMAYEFRKDPKSFIKKLSEHYITIGGKKIIDPIQNAKKPDSGTTSSFEAAPKTPAEAMAKQGKLVSGG